MQVLCSRSDAGYIELMAFGFASIGRSKHSSSASETLLKRNKIDFQRS